MSTSEASLTSTPDASGNANPSTSTVADTSSAGTSLAPLEQTADTASVGNAVQENQSAQAEADPFEGVPSLDELQVAADKDTPYAKSLIQLRNALDPLKTKYSELETRFKPFEKVADRFSAPEELESLVQMREALLGWENVDGRLLPSTDKFISTLDPQRAEFLFADLADGTTTDQNGQQVPRMDKALSYIAQDPARRANALRILGGVEPSAVAPQWQPTQDELDAVAIDSANPTQQDRDLQEVYRKLPYDTRQQLSTNEPEFIRDYLRKEKLQTDLTQEREQSQTERRERAQQAEQMLQHESQQAGDQHVATQLNDAYATFTKSVVDQCKFIQPLDPQAPPQGMDASQVAAFNQQAEATNLAEGAGIVLATLGVINEQTRPFALSMLQQIGVIDDKFLKELDTAAKGFGDNARNYGQLTFRGQRQSNGQYQPGADVTGLNNEASRNLNKLKYLANQISSRLIEKKSGAFGMRATGHNNLLNSVAAVRPGANGTSFNPATAPAQQPSGWLSRAEIEQQFSG